MHTDSTDALRGHVSALGSTSMVVAACSTTRPPGAHTRPTGGVDSRNITPIPANPSTPTTSGRAYETAPRRLYVCYRQRSCRGCDKDHGPGELMGWGKYLAYIWCAADAGGQRCHGAGLGPRERRALRN